jgi:hypothetical protein
VLALYELDLQPGSLRRIQNLYREEQISTTAITLAGALLSIGIWKGL